MRVLTVYGRIYADCLRQALAGIRKNPWTLLLPVGLLIANTLASSLVLSLGAIGRFLVWIVTAAALSCYLYFLGEVVAKSRVRPGDFVQSIGPYFWSVANLFFVVWVAQLLLSLFTAGTPQAPLFGTMLLLAAAILLNASPETIYQRGSHGGLTPPAARSPPPGELDRVGHPQPPLPRSLLVVPRRPGRWAGLPGLAARRGAEGRPVPSGDGLPRSSLRRDRRHQPPAADVQLARCGLGLTGEAQLHMPLRSQL
jgi:hypothetical protein